MHVSHPSTVAQHLNPKEGVTPYNIESTCILPMRFLIAGPRILGEVRHTFESNLAKIPTNQHRETNAVSSWLCIFKFFCILKQTPITLIPSVSPPGTQNAGDATVMRSMNLVTIPICSYV
jgi:hypothetical protein